MTDTPEQLPRTMDIEAARLLANDARDELEECDEEELRRLADTFVAQEGSGDVAAFVRWVRNRPS